MSTGMAILLVGTIGVLINTACVVVFYLKMKKENEKAFITFRGLDEPNTSYYVAHLTITISDGKPKVFERNTEEFGTIEDDGFKIDDTIPL
ncbi:MAG: hypothetical protein LBV08_04885 [Clostridiales bacterium]|jgi:Co/Zn/Cd efflux system component|nr:hypothetical protein [Clostridiales bacterium]